MYFWILNVLRYGVLDFFLYVFFLLVYWLFLKVFVSKILVRLKIGFEDGFKVKLRNVCFLKFKILSLDLVVFVEGEIGFVKFLFGCFVFEELSLCNLEWGYWGFCYVVFKIFKRLMLFCVYCDDNFKSVLFDILNVVYFKYFDNIV